jgi:hypothetical protein
MEKNHKQYSFSMTAECPIRGDEYSFSYDSRGTLESPGEKITPEQFECPGVFDRQNGCIFCKHPKILKKPAIYAMRVCVPFFDARREVYFGPMPVTDEGLRKLEGVYALADSGHKPRKK